MAKGRRITYDGTVISADLTKRPVRRSVRNRLGAAIALGGALVAWVAVSFFVGLWPGGVPAASSAYEYQYSGSVTGSGTIASPTNKQVSFDLSAKTDSSGTTGTCTVNESATKTKFKCLSVTSLTFASLANGCSRAVLDGSGTLNGNPTTYEIQAQDCGEPGVGLDSFAIQAGGFARNGTLTSGNIQVHGFP